MRDDSFTNDCSIRLKAIAMENWFRHTKHKHMTKQTYKYLTYMKGNRLQSCDTVTGRKHKGIITGKRRVKRVLQYELSYF